VNEILGEGTFCKVYRCTLRHDRPLFPDTEKVPILKDANERPEYSGDVAIKVVRAQKKYRSSAFIEINTIQIMHLRQPFLHESCVEILDWFAIGNHVCMVFPLLGTSLLTYIERVKFCALDFLRDFAWQILVGLARLHNQGLIHTDLKPENIVFLNPLVNRGNANGARRDGGGRHSPQPDLPASTEIRLIDFGNSTYQESYHSRIVGTRHYRAPEVLLNLDWSYASDLWAVGCILLEAYTGSVVFSPKTDFEHLGMLDFALGPIPSRMGRSARREAQEFFDRNGRLRWSALRRESHSFHNVERVKRIRDLIRARDEDFYHLIRSLLEYDPDERCTAQQALKLPFFSRLSAYRQLDPDVGNHLSLPAIKISSQGTVSRV